MSTKDWSAEIQAWMGHKNSSSLNRYANVTTDEVLQLLSVGRRMAAKGAAAQLRITLSIDPVEGYIVEFHPKKEETK